MPVVSTNLRNIRFLLDSCYFSQPVDVSDEMQLWRWKTILNKVKIDTTFKLDISLKERFQNLVIKSFLTASSMFTIFLITQSAFLVLVDSTMVCPYLVIA